MFIDLPNISDGTSEQQIEEIKSYIYKHNEQINLALADYTLENQLEKINSILSAGNPDKAGNDYITSEKKRYRNVKDLLIKTADVVFNSEDKYKRILNGSYLAKGEFGSYLLNTRLEVLETSRSVEELFTYAAEANEYTVFNKTTFKRGLLTDEGVVPPIYGLEIGLLDYEFLKDENDEDVLDENGNKILIESDSDKFLRITPDGLSLYKNQNEVARLDASALYFPNAHITGGEISIGGITSNPNFEVDTNGNVTTRGTVSIGNGFSVDSNGNVTASNARLTDCYIDVATDAIGFNFYIGSRSNQLGGAGAAISPNTSNEGAAFNSRGNSYFIEFGNLILQKSDGYFTNSAAGLYVTDDYFSEAGVTRNYSRAHTQNVTIDGTTLMFKSGLFIGVQ